MLEIAMQVSDESVETNQRYILYLFFFLRGFPPRTIDNGQSDIDSAIST